jgi:retinol dehydrogenase 12
MDAREGSLSGRIPLVTGATSGIGLETARTLVRLGAHVVIGVRDLDRGRAVVEQLSEVGSAELLPLDLASFASIRAAAARFLETHPVLDVLVNNAGVVPAKRRVTADGHELTWETNFLGPFLLTTLLLPALRAARAPRVVNVSSVAHKQGRIRFDDPELARERYAAMKAYAQSKLALNLFTRELARREPGIAVNAVHPGGINTGIWREAPAWLRALLRVILPPPERGAVPVVRLATASDVAGLSGRYFDKLRETAPSQAAQDDAAAARLWELAEAATRRRERSDLG